MLELEDDFEGSGDDSPSVYRDSDGRIVYRASATGGCSKALIHHYEGEVQLIGQKRRDLLERTAKEGHIHERAVKEQIAREGARVVDQQKLVENVVMPNVVIRGHIEGLIQTDNGKDTQRVLGFTISNPALTEIKSLSNKRFDAWKKHRFVGDHQKAWQISNYMKPYPDLDVLYICKRREDGTMDIIVIPAGEPPVPWKTIRNKILLVEKHRRALTEPACDVPQWGCPFWNLHEEDDGQDDYEPGEEEIAILEEILPKWHALKVLEDEAKEAEIERKRLSKEVINLMGNKKKLEIEIGGELYKVTQVNSSGTGMDQKQVREDHGTKYDTSYKYSYPTVRKVKG